MSNTTHIERCLIDQASPRQLLLIDDSPDDCRLIANFSQRHNVVWTIASNYDDAVAKMLAHRYSLIFLDLNLGTFADGIRTFTHIKRAKIAPVIVLSGCIDAAIVSQITSVGVTVFAQKPRCFTSDYFDELFELMNIPLKPEEIVI